jgi:hypothetical protein
VPRLDALAVSEAVSSWGYSGLALGRRQLVVVGAWLLPLPAVPASVAAMMTGGVVTEDFGKLQWVSTNGEGKCNGACLPVSEGAFSLPANSRRLEIDGSDGFFSSAGGDGGD